MVARGSIKRNQQCKGLFMLLLPVLFFVLKRKQVELFRGGVTKDYIAFYFTYMMFVLV